MTDKLVETKEPITFEEICNFIDMTSISSLDVHELKSMIADCLQAERNKVVDDCLTIIKTKHMIRTTDDDFCADIEVPFYRKLYESVNELKGGAG